MISFKIISYKDSVFTSYKLEDYFKKQELFLWFISLTSFKIDYIRSIYNKRLPSILDRETQIL